MIGRKCEREKTTKELLGKLKKTTDTLYHCSRTESRNCGMSNGEKHGALLRELQRDGNLYFQGT